MLFCGFQQFLGLIKTLTVEEFSETGLFMRFGNHGFRSQQLQKYLSCQVQFFFLNFQNLT